MCDFCGIENNPGFKRCEQMINELTEEEQERLMKRIIDDIIGAYCSHKIMEERRAELRGENYEE